MNPFSWLKNHLREATVVVLAALVLVNLPALIRVYDPTAGQLDGSVFQLVAWAGLLFVGGISLLWVGISAAFPTVNRHLDSGQFRRDFTGLTNWNRTVATLWTLTLLTALLAVCLVCSHLTAPPSVTLPLPPPSELPAPN